MERERVAVVICIGQRSAQPRSFCPSTTWTPGITSGCHAWWQALCLLAEPPHTPNKTFLRNPYCLSLPLTPCLSLYGNLFLDKSKPWFTLTQWLILRLCSAVVCGEDPGFSSPGVTERNSACTGPGASGCGSHRKNR